MRYKELGKTGMKISHLCFGASSLGSVFRSTKEAESIEDANEVVSEFDSAEEMQKSMGYLDGDFF